MSEKDKKQEESVIVRLLKSIVNFFVGRKK